jgi:hypothetical protein
MDPAGVPCNIWKEAPSPSRWRGGAIEWNLLNQRWRFKLVPTMIPELATILSQPFGDFAPADISSLSREDVFLINTH